MAQSKPDDSKTNESNISQPMALKKQASYNLMKSKATDDRLKELSSLTRDHSSNRRGRGSNRASFGPTKTNMAKLQKSKSNDKKSPNENRSYSIAATNGKNLKKVEQDIQRQYELAKSKKNQELKQWQESQRNLFQTTKNKKNNIKVIDNDEISNDDEKDDKPNDEDSHKLSPVTNNDSSNDDIDNTDHSTANNKPSNTKPEIPLQRNKTNDSNSKINNNHNQQNSHSQQPQQSQNSNYVPYIMGATASNLDLPRRRHNTPHIINPCAPLPGHNQSRNEKKRKSSGLKNIGRFFFGKKKDKDNKDKEKHMDTINENNQKSPPSMTNAQFKPPKRVVYELDDQKYELYSWLKPTKTLGQGAYATVIEVKDGRTKRKFAIKKNRDVFNNVADARRILREIKLMIHMNHENIMGLIGCIPPERWDINTFEEVYLMMPRCDTTLKRVIRSRQTLTQDHIIFFAYQIARGLQYMHSGNIIHRDLKPENILVNISNCRITITDFGLARGVNTDVDSPQKLTEYVVTRWYRAPEVMCCRKWYEARIDVWSLGCVIAELYTRKPLWKGKHSRDQLNLIFDTLGTPTTTDWITTDSQKRWIKQLPYKKPKDLEKVLPGSTPLARDFIAHMLVYNPAERPTISQVIDHPFLASRKKDRHYKECPKFNISFEYEKKIKTSFGVRHMMYEELAGFHRRIVEYERRAMMPRKVFYPQFNLSFGLNHDDMYQLLVTGYINQISDAFGLLLPADIAQCICLFSNLCFKYDDAKSNFIISGPMGSCIERVNDIGYQNIYNEQELQPEGKYMWKLKVKKINHSVINYCDVGVIDARFLNPNASGGGANARNKYSGYGYASKRLQIGNVDEIIDIELDFEYDGNKDNGQLSIKKYIKTMSEKRINFKYSCLVPKSARYRLAIAMEQTGFVLDLIHFYCEQNKN